MITPKETESQEGENLIISKREAISIGLTRYFTGKPCIHGHIAPRKVHSSACTECARVLTNLSRYPYLNGETPRKNGRVSVFYINQNMFDYSESADIFALNQRVRSFKRRSKKENAGGYHKYSDILEILIMQEYMCGNHMCRKNLKDHGYDVDHIVPLSKGGSNWPDNLQCLCRTCNSSKGAKMPEDLKW